MTYNYVCPNCSLQVTISKPIIDSDKIEHCVACYGELKRVWEAPMIKTNDGVKR